MNWIAFLDAVLSAISQDALKSIVAYCEQADPIVCIVCLAELAPDGHHKTDCPVRLVQQESEN